MNWMRRSAGGLLLLAAALALTTCGRDVVTPRQDMASRANTTPTPGATVGFPWGINPQGYNYQETRFLWNVVKSSDVSQLDLGAGATGTINYTLNFTRTYSGVYERHGAKGYVCLVNTGADPTQGLSLAFTVQVSTDGGATYADQSTTFVDLSSLPSLPPDFNAHCYNFDVPISPTTGATYRLMASVTITNDQTTGATGTSAIYSESFELPTAVEAYVDGASASFSDAIACPAGFTCSSALTQNSVKEEITNVGTYTTVVPYVVTVTNTGAACGAFELVNTVTGKQLNDTQHLYDFTDTHTVTLHGPSCAQPALSLLKTADAASVVAGSPIGFTMKVTNDGQGVAQQVTLSDLLPAGAGLSWSISPANAACTLVGGVLSCSFGDLAANASASVHVSSPTTTQSCGSYINTAMVQASNAPAVQASANMQVTCPQPTPCPAGSFTFQMQANGDLLMIYDQFPAPNDNSYGVNAVGWPNGHRFSDLFNSDHAGFQLVDPSGIVRLSFNVDYLTASTTAPSGYQSLGVNGGDGKMIVGTAGGISATTSLDRNLNGVNIPGLFNAAHVQQFGSVNVLMDSPPTDAAHQTYVISDPALLGWDFHDTYFVTVSAAKLASLGFNINTWRVEPNLSQLHNSPAKPCPPTGAALSITKYEVRDRQVKITIFNSGSAAVYLTALTLEWPSTTNGKLMQVKLDGDIVYDNPDIAGGTADLTTAQLVADQNKRKIDRNTSDVYTLVFERNADPDLSHYAGTVTIGGTVLTVLPH